MDLPVAGFESLASHNKEYIENFIIVPCKDLQIFIIFIYKDNIITVNMNKKTEYHYFYKITNNINGHFYYGVHNTNNLDDGYMGSGKRLHYAYKKYGMKNFTKEILKYFDTSKEAFEYEAEVVNEVLVEDPNCYNITIGGKGSWYIVNGTIPVKDNNGNIMRVEKNDPRYLSGELVGIAKGLFAARDKNGKYYQISKNDPRYLSGELVSVFSGNVIVKDNKGNKFMVSKDDPRYLSGDVVPIWKDRKHKNESRNKTRETMTKENSTNPRIWINKDGIVKYLLKTKLQEYLNSGWELGRPGYKPCKNGQGKEIKI